MATSLDILTSRGGAPTSVRAGFLLQGFGWPDEVIISMAPGFSFWSFPLGSFFGERIGNKFLGTEPARVDVAVFIGKVVDFRAAFNVVFGR